MACSNQKTIISTLIVISLLSIISLTHGGDNDPLVYRMCGATFAPNVCISCINSDGRGAQTEGDVIQEMLGCGDSDALRLEQDVNKILDDVQTDPKTRTTLFSINPLIQAIISAGGTVQVQAAQRRFNDARSTITNVIFPKLGACNSAFSAAGVSIPPPVFSGLFSVEADYKLSDQLIASVRD